MALADRTNADFCLPTAYQSRRARNAGLTTTDGAQTRVYRWAAEIAAADPSIQTVLDWGTGSGAKLVAFFGHLDTLGADVAERMPTLRARYPHRFWAVCPVPVDADLVLCVDVIEHVADPLALLRQFNAGDWRHLIISTPERNQVARHKYGPGKIRRQQLAGPPANRWHAREWTQAEFVRLVSREIGPPVSVCILGRWNLVVHCSRALPTVPAVEPPAGATAGLNNT